MEYDLIDLYAEVAQLVEHFLGKEEVSGSSPDFSSINACFGTSPEFFYIKHASTILH